MSFKRKEIYFGLAVRPIDIRHRGGLTVRSQSVIISVFLLSLLGLLLFPTGNTETSFVRFCSDDWGQVTVTHTYEKGNSAVTVANGLPSLLIIAHEDFLGELEPLAEWKARTGFQVELISWQYLNNSFYGWDEAVRIRKGIQLRHQMGHADYVMLVGDCEMFPVRYQFLDRIQNDSSDVDGYGCYFPCDLYYADLIGPTGTYYDWDPDANHIYGELHGEYFTSDPINFEELDLIPDLAIGRVPASNILEVRNYVEKILLYEGGQLGSWFKNALYIVPNSPADDLDEIYLATKEDINATALTKAEGFTPIRLYNASISGLAASLTDGAPTEANIIVRLNTGVGFVNFGGHGNSQAWGNCFFTTSISSPTLTSTRWPVAVSVGCGTGKIGPEPPYEAYTDVNGAAHLGIKNGELWPVVGDPTLPPPACLQTDTVDSFAEHLLTRTRLRGAMGYFACVSGAQSWSSILDLFFFQNYTEHCLLGDMWRDMVTRYCDTPKSTEGSNLGAIGRGETSITSGGSWFKVAGYHQPLKFLLYGDPSLRVGSLANFPPTNPYYYSGPNELDEGEECVFDADWWHFTDYDSPSLTFRWDLDGDASWDTGWTPTPIAHTYPDNQEVDVHVQASDGLCYSEVQTQTFVIHNVAPTVTLTGDTNIGAGDTIGFRLTVTDPGTADTFTYYWEFGEGATPETSTSHYPTVTFE
ncbi:MAG: C25 family cysteine peptidase, partial [Candidatus Hermodarchaeota archaeon]|nr:C25 family cysteine peptidase [Candidatus Hermodarchaeota archaeon]